MANVTVSTNPSTKNDTLTVDFTTDIDNITDVLLTKDGGTYISATSFTNTSATFNVASWGNGIYDNCYLKVIYTEASSGGSTGGGSTEVPIELVFHNGMLNPSTGVEEAHSVIGITDFIQASTNKTFTCTTNNCYLDIFIYDSNGNFESKTGYDIGVAVQFTFLSTKKYKLEITPSDWVTQITNSNYTNFIVNHNIQ